MVEEEINTVCIPKQQHSDKDVKEAKRAKLTNWKATEAVDLVKDNRTETHFNAMGNNGKGRISWIIQPKVRLVIRGFEDTNDVQVDAPTVSKATMGMFCKTPNREGVGNKMYRLRKAAYELADAARNWYLSVKEVYLLHKLKYVP